MADEQQPPAPETPKPGQAVVVTVRHWYTDPIVALCLVEFTVSFLSGLQDAMAKNPHLDSGTIWSLLTSAVVAVVRARYPEVHTSSPLFDKPRDGRNP